MKRTVAYRIAADICFAFAVFCIFPELQTYRIPMALFAAASLAVSLAAVYCKAAPLRFLLALLPGLACLTATIDRWIVFPALVWLYLILMLTAGRFHVHLEEYRKMFRIQFIVWLSLLTASSLLQILADNKRDYLPSVCFALVFLCLGVFAMRRMQMNTETDHRWDLANAAVVTGIPLTAAGCSALLYLFLRLLIPLIGKITPYLARFLAWVVNFLFRSHPEKVVENNEDPYELTPEEAELHDHFNNPGYKPETLWEPDSLAIERAARIMTYVLIALALLAAVYFIVRLVRRNRKKPVQDQYLYEDPTESKPLRRRKAVKEADLSNAGKLRSIYRSYMQLMQKRGIHIRKATTSGEILDEAELRSVSPDAERLRELYLKVRYADESNITDADIEEATDCLRRIREDDSWKKAGNISTPAPEMLSPNITFDAVRQYLYNDYLEKK